MGAIRGAIVEAILNGFPFSNEGSGIRKSLEFTGEMIDKGYSLLIAPEGMASPDGYLQPFQNGAGLLAVDLGVDVVPIKIQREYRDVFPDLRGRPREWFPQKRKRIKVKIGAPLHFRADTDYAEATAQMEAVMRAL